jgi:hypothetical protein
MFSELFEISERYVSPGGLPQARLGDDVVMTTLMLMCAVLASLALGVLVAYGICQVMFRLFRMHAISAAKSRVAAAEPQVAGQS